MARVVHFEIHAESPERAVHFYGNLFDWQFTKWDGPQEYWLIRTGPASEPGIDGGMVRRRGAIDGQAVIAYVCTVSVESIDGILGRLPEQGGAVVLPKQAIPGVGWLAYAKDPEGNIFGMMQNDPAAA